MAAKKGNEPNEALMERGTKKGGNFKKVKAVAMWLELDDFQGTSGDGVRCLYLKGENCNFWCKKVNPKPHIERGVMQAFENQDVFNVVMVYDENTKLIEGLVVHTEV